MEIDYLPRGDRQLQPFEVLERSELLPRIKGRELSSRQRASFHQLVVCTSGEGVHRVDYTDMPMTRGTILRIHPGQVQQFVTQPHFEATLLVWPPRCDRQDSSGRSWFPGNPEVLHWQCDYAFETKLTEWIDELRAEQRTFDGSERRIELMTALLHALLLRLAIERESPRRNEEKPPIAYLEFRELIEQRLLERPSIAALASELGFSTRTLNRACHKASGRTAKQLLDERVALEVRRLLTHTDRPVARISADFGFSDQSNFSKFVKRHIGATPQDVRRSG